MDKAIIDVNALKKKYNQDSIPQHLWSIALDCKKRRDAYWRHAKRLKMYNNLISIPLLILSSLTGLTSVAQLGVVSYSEKINDGEAQTTKEITSNGSNDSITLPLIVTISGVSSAILTAFQRYFRYAERSEHSKHMAKNYGRIGRRIENTMVILESAAIKIEPEMFKKFIEDIQKDTDSLMQETEELPSELLNKKSFYKDFLKKLKREKIIAKENTNNYYDNHNGNDNHNDNGSNKNYGSDMNNIRLNSKYILSRANTNIDIDTYMHDIHNPNNIDITKKMVQASRAVEIDGSGPSMTDYKNIVAHETILESPLSTATLTNSVHTINHK